MNYIIKTILVTLLTIFFSVTCIGQNIKPIKPKKPVDTLKLPDAVIDMDVTVGKLPKQIKFGVITKLDGKFKESYDFAANVKEIKKEGLKLLYKDDKPADVIYRLPKGMSLNLKEGDDISLFKKSFIVGAGLGYNQHIKSRNRVKLAASKVYGDKPLVNKVFEGVFIKQTTIDPSSATDSEYMKSSRLKVVLTQRYRNIPLAFRKVNEVTINRVKYQIFVQASSYSEAKPGSIEPEFQGYLLEYYIVEQ